MRIFAVETKIFGGLCPPPRPQVESPLDFHRRFACQPSEWPRLRATVVKEARCCRWPTTPYTSNIQQVADDDGRRVQARVHGADFRPARG